MRSKLLSVHGTGASDVTKIMDQITECAQAILGWSPDQVVSLEWGREVEPEDLDIRTALPREYPTRGMGDELREAEQEAAMWDLLLVDPFAELRMLVVAMGQDAETVRINWDLASVEVQDRLDGLVFPSESLDRAEMTAEPTRTSTTMMRDSQELTVAADRTDHPDDAELVFTTARAIFALSPARRLPTLAGSREQPGPANDGSVREELVGDVTELVSPGTRGQRYLGEASHPERHQNRGGEAYRLHGTAQRADWVWPAAGMMRSIVNELRAQCGVLHAGRQTLRFVGWRMLAGT